MNKQLAKGYRYYMRLSAFGGPVIGSVVLRKRKPAEAGNWVDITSCMGDCCIGVGGDATVALEQTTSPMTGNILEDMNLDGDLSTYTVGEFDAVMGDVTISVSDDGNYTITAASGVEQIVNFTITITDNAGNVKYLPVSIDVDIP